LFFYLRCSPVKWTPGADAAEQQDEDGQGHQGGQQDEQPEEHLVLGLVLGLQGSEGLLKAMKHRDPDHPGFTYVCGRGVRRHDGIGVVVLGQSLLDLRYVHLEINS